MPPFTRRSRPSAARFTARFARVLAWLALLSLAPVAALAASNDDAAWEALRRDGAIALIRHADAPGVGDPAGWKLGDCATQRNLSEAGRAQARSLGEKIRAERIVVARVLASPWCRTVETATLLGAGAVRDEATFANAFVLGDRRDALASGARAVIARWRGPGTLLVVTHGENIAALTGRSPATAELVVVAPGPHGTVRELGAVLTPVPR